MSQQLEFMSIGGGSDDLSPQQLMEAANNWAKRNAFSPEQLQVLCVVMSVWLEDGF